MRRSRPLSLSIVYCAFSAVLLIATYVTLPPELRLRTARYGFTTPREFRILLLVLGIEIAVFGLLLRPWSYAHSWRRALVSLVVLTPWVLLQLVLGIHAGPPQHVHTDLLLILWIALLAVTLAGASDAARTWYATRRQAAP